MYKRQGQGKALHRLVTCPPHENWGQPIDSLPVRVCPLLEEFLAACRRPGLADVYKRQRLYPGRADRLFSAAAGWREVSMKVTLIGLGMGDQATLTWEGRQALEAADMVIGAQRLLDSLPEGVTANRRALIQPQAILDLSLIHI